MVDGSGEAMPYGAIAVWALAARGFLTFGRRKEARAPA
jgi:hypothetical protein